MTKCFVIQPFDRGRYDKRYEDVFVPAIRGAGLKPYRVDKDPSVTIPIGEIQAGIESSDICLAEISTDNPNVWFELGYAIASRREVVLVCSEERKSHFPFDVQHRSIIRYSTESPRDFDQLRSKITTKLKAVLENKERLGHLGRIPSLTRLEGLEQHEVATLVAVAQQVDNLDEEGIPAYLIRENMEKAGFTKIAAALGLKTLLDKGMLSPYQEYDDFGNAFTIYRITEDGVAWLLANKEMLTLTQDPVTPSDSDDIPF